MIHIHMIHIHMIHYTTLHYTTLTSDRSTGFLRAPSHLLLDLGELVYDIYELKVDRIRHLWRCDAMPPSTNYDSPYRYIIRSNLIYTF